MDENDLTIGAAYLYEGTAVWLVGLRRFKGQEQVWAIIECPPYQRLWVKPEELARAKDPTERSHP